VCAVYYLSQLMHILIKDLHTLKVLSFGSNRFLTQGQPITVVARTKKSSVLGVTEAEISGSGPACDLNIPFVTIGRRHITHSGGILPWAIIFYPLG
jgi:hypothetical protein